MDLDPTDRRLLALLQGDSRASPERLAAEVGASTATVQRRLKRLRASGVILREGAQLDPKALGYAMTFLVLVELERERGRTTSTRSAAPCGTSRWCSRPTT